MSRLVKLLASFGRYSGKWMTKPQTEVIITKDVVNVLCHIEKV